MAGSYFSHDSNARNDEKILRLRMKLGWEGYGLYWALIEKLRDSDNYACVKDYNVIAFDLRTDAAKIKSIIEDFGLFASTEDGRCIYSESLLRRMEAKEKVSDARRNSILKRWYPNGNTNVLETEYKPYTNVLQKNTNKSKVKKNLKETSYGGKEKPAPSAEPEPEIPEGGFPGTGQEECEAYPVEAGNLQKKENSGGAAQNPASGGVSPGGMVKPPSEARKSRSIEENMRICQESASWLEAVAMQNGMTVEGIKAELAKFPEHLDAYGHDEPKPLNDFKAHFNNYLRIRKKDADDSAKARGARKGTGEAAAGGVGSRAERPRPKPLF